MPTPSAIRRIGRIGLQAIPTVLLVLIVNFVLIQLAPGDAADAILGDAAAGDFALLGQFRDALGIQTGLWAQLASYAGGLVHLNLGTSLLYGIPVTDVVLERLGYSFQLMITAFLLSLILGVLTGTLMAAFAGSWLDRLLSGLLVALYSMPPFWIGLMLVVLFASRLGWLPSGGAGTAGLQAQGLESLADRARHLVLPACAAAAFYLSVYARLVRATILEVQDQDYIRTAKAKGIGPLRVLVVHVLRNALIPLTTMAGLYFGGLLGGAVVVETVFGWPGIGRLMVDAVEFRDYPVLLGVLLMTSFIVILANLAVDILQTFLDPRIGDG